MKKFIYFNFILILFSINFISCKEKESLSDLDTYIINNNKNVNP